MTGGDENRCPEPAPVQNDHPKSRNLLMQLKLIRPAVLGTLTNASVARKKRTVIIHGNDNH